MQSLRYNLSLQELALLEQAVAFLALADFFLAALAGRVFVVLLVLIFSCI